MERIAVAKVLTTHGIKGAVKVLPLTDFPERLRDLKTVYICHHGKSVRAQVIGAQPAKRGQWILQFAEFSTIDKAEELRNALIKIDREDLVSLPEDHYFVFDLVGCKVISSDGKVLGHLREVLSTGANDVYVVEPLGAGKELLLPATKEVVRKIDLAAGQIVVRVIPGLLD